MGIKRKLVRGSAWVLVGRVVAASSGLGINILLARLLTAEELGQYFVLITLTMLAVMVASMGLPKSIIRLVASDMTVHKGKETRSILMKSSALLVFLSALISLLLAVTGDVLLGFFIEETLPALLIILLAIGVFQKAIIGFIAETFRAFHAIGIATFLGGVFQSLLFLMVLFVLWFFIGEKVGIEDVYLLEIGAGFSALLGALWFFRKKMRTLPDTMGENIGYTYIFQSSMPMLGIAILSFITLQADILIASAFCSAEDVAAYGLVVRTVVLISLPLTIINGVLPPMISELYAQGDKIKLEKILRSTATLIAVPSIIFLIVLIFFASNILSMLYGEGYAGAAMLLVILCVGQIINVLSGSCALTLIHTGNQGKVLTTMSITGGVSFILIVMLASIYGVVGVAVAVATGVAIRNMMLVWSTSRHLNINTFVYLDLFKIIDSIRLGTSLIKRGN